MAIFYAPNIKETNTLPEEESQHAIKVLRMEAGERLEIIDGKGNFFEAEIKIANHKHCEIQILTEIKEYKKRETKLHIAIAPTKNLDRIEWFAEKATEIGIEEITPIICQFSERKMIKTERIEKILISAMKQSQKAYLPKINEVCSFKTFINKEQKGMLFFGHCYKDDKKQLSTTYQAGQDATIMIGPEGDFSIEEVQEAISKKFIPITLGDNRLRTETAGIVACDTFNIINEISKINYK